MTKIFTDRHLRNFSGKPNFQLCLAVILSLAVVVPFIYYARFFGFNKFAWTEVILLLSALVFCGSFRKYPISVFCFFLLFIAGNESYIRLKYFGIDGFNLAKVHRAEPGSPLSGSQFDGNSYTHLKPGTTAHCRGHEFRVNNLGMRGPDYQFEKKPHTFRIVLIGTCSAEGDGVPYESSYPYLLEKELKADNLNVEVVNLSIAGSYSNNMLHVLKELAPKFSPDLILYDMTLFNPPAKVRRLEPRIYNDPHTTSVGLDESFLFFSAPMDMLKTVIDRPFSENIVKPLSAVIPVLKRFGYRVTKDDLKDDKRWSLKIIQEVRPAGVPLALYVLPPLGKDWSPTAQIKQREELKMLADQVNLPVIDVFSAANPRLGVLECMCYPGDYHPSAIVHKAFAHKIAEQVKPLITSPKPERVVR